MKPVYAVAQPPPGTGRHSVPALEAQPTIGLLWKMLHFYMRGYHNITVVRGCSLPAEGPAILVSNHVSGLDPLVLQAACPRVITWMMAREYYQIRAFGPLFRLIRAIPVDRSGRDLAATRAALRALQDGQVIGIFPEGRISLTQDVQPFQTGVALVACKAGVGVYPAALRGTMPPDDMLGAFLLPQQARVSFGQPIHLGCAGSSRQDIERATDTIRAAVLSLLAELDGQVQSVSHRL